MRAIGLVVLMSVACASTSPLIITGDAIDAASDTMIATEAGMRSLSDQHALTKSQVDAWNGFEKQFIASFDLACSLWRAAKATNNDAIEQQAAAIVGALIAGLAPFTAELAKAKGAPQ